MGIGIESSSHKYGLFHESIITYEIVLPDGSLTQVTKQSNKELFESLSYSHGTVAILTSVQIKIIKIKKYIKLKYKPFD